MAPAVWNPRVETFFTQLPERYLSNEENRLLRALRECLAALSDMRLPAGVAIKDWALRRVPHEAQALSQIWSDRTYVSPMAPPASASQPWQGREAKRQGGDNQPHPDKRRRMGPPMSDEARYEYEKERQERARAEKERQDRARAFLSHFPHEEFTAKEVALREALLDFLHRRAKVDPGTAPAVSEAKCPKKGPKVIADLCRTILPPGVGLRDWIENRIASEVEVQWDNARSCSVLVLLDNPVDYDCGFTETPAHNTYDGYENWRESKTGVFVREEKERERESKVDAFMSTLPPDKLTDIELELREAVLSFLDRYEEEHPGVAPRVSEAGAKGGDPWVSRLCRKFLPQSVGLRDWINYRIGEEVQAPFDDTKRCTVIVRTSP